MRRNEGKKTEMYNIFPQFTRLIVVVVVKRTPPIYLFEHYSDADMK